MEFIGISGLLTIVVYLAFEIKTGRLPRTTRALTKLVKFFDNIYITLANIPAFVLILVLIDGKFYPLRMDGYRSGIGDVTIGGLLLFGGLTVALIMGIFELYRKQP